MQCIVWNAETGAAVHIIDTVHTDLVLSVAWSRSGSVFATTSRDGFIRVIEPRSRAVVAVRTSPSIHVHCMCLRKSPAVIIYTVAVYYKHRGRLPA